MRCSPYSFFLTGSSVASVSSFCFTDGLSWVAWSTLALRHQQPKANSFYALGSCMPVGHPFPSDYACPFKPWKEQASDSLSMALNTVVAHPEACFKQWSLSILSHKEDKMWIFNCRLGPDYSLFKTSETWMECVSEHLTHTHTPPPQLHLHRKIQHKNLTSLSSSPTATSFL